MFHSNTYYLRNHNQVSALNLSFFLPCTSICWESPIRQSLATSLPIISYANSIATLIKWLIEVCFACGCEPRFLVQSSIGCKLMTGISENAGINRNELWAVRSTQRKGTHAKDIIICLIVHFMWIVSLVAVECLEKCWSVLKTSVKRRISRNYFKKWHSNPGNILSWDRSAAEPLINNVSMPIRT